MMQTYKEVAMEMSFIKCGDYYIPDIKLEKPNIRLGKWGRMRREYLRLAHPVIFSDMDIRLCQFDVGDVVISALYKIQFHSNLLINLFH